MWGDNAEADKGRKDMATIRRLQKMGGQYHVNVPASLAKSSRMQKGDYLEITEGNRDSFGVRKVADANASRDDVLIQQLELEAQHLFALTSSADESTDPAAFSFHQAKLSHVTGKLRRLRVRRQKTAA